MKTKTKKIYLNGFKPPKNNIEELLLHLILEKEISLFDFPYLVSYRTRISDLQLKYGLFLERKFETKFNKYGNAYTYAIHSLSESEKPKAIALYEKLNSN